MLFSKTHWPQLLVPLEYLTSKISLKDIPINMYLFLTHQGDQEHEIVQSLLLVSQEFKYEETQMPNSFNHPSQ